MTTKKLIAVLAEVLDVDLQELQDLTEDEALEMLEARQSQELLNLSI